MKTRKMKTGATFETNYSQLSMIINFSEALKASL